jgi:hypothetical protein
VIRTSDILYLSVYRLPCNSSVCQQITLCQYSLAALDTVQVKCLRASSYFYVTRNNQRHSVLRSLRYSVTHLWLKEMDFTEEKEGLFSIQYHLIDFIAHTHTHTRKIRI